MGGNLEHFPFIWFFPTETIAGAGAVVLEISACADGGPRSRVRARGTLRSAPHRH